MKGTNKKYVIGSSIAVVLGVLLYFNANNIKKEIDDSEVRFQLYSLENIGWKSKKNVQKVDDIIFEATEVPIQYYILKDKGKQDLFTIDSIFQENKTERIYEFTFLQDEEKDLLASDFTKRSYEDAVKYISFGLDKDFYIVTSKKDTIKANGVNFERSFKISPYQKVLIYFSGISPNDKVQLVYNDKLFRKGLLKFKFKDKYIKIDQ